MQQVDDTYNRYAEGVRLGVAIGYSQLRQDVSVKQAGLADVAGNLGHLMASAPQMAALAAIAAGSSGGLLYNTLKRHALEEDLKLEAKEKQVRQHKEIAINLQRKIDEQNKLDREVMEREALKALEMGPQINERGLA